MSSPFKKQKKTILLKIWTSNMFLMLNILFREQQAAAVIAQQPKERPDVNHHLKFTYGVS